MPTNKKVLSNGKIKINAKKPTDYHCTCSYCRNYYRGELLPNTPDGGKYLSGRTREGYSQYEKSVKHLCPGHWSGYSFTVDNYTDKGDLVLDPFAGSGTALVEALKLGRKVKGIELEFFPILKENVKLYPKKDWEIFKGDSRKLIKNIQDGSIDLIVTGPPYNDGSDPPERKDLAGKDSTFGYNNNDSFGLLKKDYNSEFESIFREFYKKLKVGGKFVTIIKDPTRNKTPYLLHHELGMLAEKAGFKPVDVYIHRHWPPTLFMNTYPKRFPDVKIPLYQTILTMEK
jgi:16S rRNA G966 N2-methylase RsmD